MMFKKIVKCHFSSSVKLVYNELLRIIQYVQYFCNTIVTVNISSKVVPSFGTKSGFICVCYSDDFAIIMFVITEFD